LVSVTARRNGLSASQLFTWRRLAPLVADLEAYMREQCAKLSRGRWFASPNVADPPA
jgi:transposase-like protein